MEPEVKIKDCHEVKLLYPSGRVVRYFYNRIFSELQLELQLAYEVDKKLDIFREAAEIRAEKKGGEDD